jgi:hypothetical protein
LHTYKGFPVDSSTCIFDIKTVEITLIDSLHCEVKKPLIEKFITYLNACSTGYKFLEHYEDKAITLLVPNYIKKVSYEMGDQKFGIVLRDGTALGRYILFSYDFDDSYKNHFLTNDNKGFKKIDIVELNNNTIYRFINWDGSFAGTLFTTNHLHVSYFTKSKEYAAELESAISKFRW